MTLEARLAAGETHEYLLDLEAGMWVELIAEQRGTDIVLALLEPNNKTLLRVDSPSGGRGSEELLAVTRSAGRHKIVVRAARGSSEKAAAGYRLTLTPPQPANQQDRRRAEAAILLAAGESLRLAGQPSPATERFERARSIFAELADTAREGEVLDRLARCAQAENRLEEAITYQHQAVERLATTSPERRSAALARLGLLYFSNAKLDRATPVWHRALALAEESESALMVGRLRHNLGHAYQRTGKPKQALAAYKAALPQHRLADNQRGEAETLHNLGVLQVFLGQDSDARRSLKAAAVHWLELGDRRAQARTLDRLGLLDLAAGNADRGAESLEHALMLRRESRDTAGEAISLSNLGLARRHQGRLMEALDHQRRALERIEGSGGSLLAEARVRESLGHVARDLKRPEEALAEHQRALGLYRHVLDSHGEASALAAIALDQRALGNLVAAYEAIQESLGLTEKSRAGLSLGEIRTTYFASVADRYQLAVETLLDLASVDPEGGWEREALAASERARARSLIDTLAGPILFQFKRRGSFAMTDAMVADAARHRTEALAAREPNPAEIERAEVAFERVKKSAVKRTYRLIYAGRPVQAANRVKFSAAGLHHWLDPDELLLEYRFGHKASTLFALAPDGRLTTHRLPAAGELEPLARRALHLLSRSHRREAQTTLDAVLCELSQHLLSPVADRLGERTLLVVAEGPVSGLPFAALPDPRSPGSCSSARPLGLVHPLRQLPSLWVRQVNRLAKRPPTLGELGIFGDPIYSRNDPRVQVETKDTKPRYGALPTLPSTRREAFALASVVSKRSPSELEREFAKVRGEPMTVRGTPDAALWLGDLADGSMLLAAARPRYRWLHLASHAFVNESRPENSALALSRFDHRGQFLSGYLRAYQIAGSEFPADLVTLSGCSTAVGQEVRGEGRMGLASAFLRAGAQSTLGSLWDVSDESTAELMEHFYRALFERELSPAEALREAQLALRSDPRWAAPYHWAAFVIFG